MERIPLKSTHPDRLDRSLVPLFPPLHAPPISFFHLYISISPTANDLHSSLLSTSPDRLTWYFPTQDVDYLDPQLFNLENGRLGRKLDEICSNLGMGIQSGGTLQQ